MNKIAENDMEATKRATEELEDLKRIGEKFCKVRFVTVQNEEGRDELRLWFTADTRIWVISMGSLDNPVEVVCRVWRELKGHVGAGVSGTSDAVNQLKTMFGKAGGWWEIEFHSLYIVVQNAKCRRAWSRHPEGVLEVLEFLTSGDIDASCMIDWDKYPHSVEWTGEKDLP